jgi:EAL domain-containing protein (putative c-di-GMP-specific phosphodiesterase class I)
MKPAHGVSSMEPEGTPAAAGGPGHFYLWFPLRHTLSLVLRELGAARREPRVLPGGDGLIVALDGDDVETFASRIAEVLSSEETAGTRVLWVPGRREPGLGDFPRVSSLRQFLAGSRTAWLRGLLEEDRVTSYFQPIVAADDTTSLFGYEALLRAFEHDTTPVSPATLLAVARETELLSEVDLAGRRTALREAARHGIRTQLFINLAQDPGAEPTQITAGLEATVRAAREAGFAPDRIVLEVIESPNVLELSHLAQTLAAYRERGFRIALDDLGAGYSSLNLMSLLRPDFVKLDLQLVRQVERDPYKAVIAEKLLELARRLGIATIAEGVETPGELAWLRGHGTDYVQGHLIAAPAAPPVQLFRRL